MTRTGALRRLFELCFLIFLCAASPFATAQSVLNPNRGFDRDLQPWFADQPLEASWNPSDATGKPDSGSARLKCPAAGCAGAEFQTGRGSTQGLFSVIPQTTYTLSADVKSASGTPSVQLSVTFICNVGFQSTCGGTAVTRTLSPEWQRPSTSAVAPAGAELAYISARLQEGEIFVDNVTLTGAFGPPRYSPFSGSENGILLSPSTITLGERAELIFVPLSATSATVNGQSVAGCCPPRDVFGFVFYSVTPTALGTAEYTATLVGPGGASSRTARVTVLPAPTVTLTANPPTITRGGSSTLMWTTTNAAPPFTLSGGEFGTGVTIVSTCPISPCVPGATSLLVKPTATTTYKMTVKDLTGTGSANAEATVTVTEPKPVVTLFTAEPLAVPSGGTTLLRWTTQNATTVTIDNGIGSVVPAAGGTKEVRNITADTRFTFTATGPGGSATASTTVRVMAVPPTARLTLNPSTIGNADETSTLSWSSTGAVTATLKRGNDAPAFVSLSGSENVKPSTTTTYTLTIHGASGANPATASETLTVVREEPPAATLKANTPLVNAGDAVTLTWTSTGATLAFIDNGVGFVQPPAGGTIRLHPRATTKYTLTVVGPGGERSARPVPVFVIGSLQSANTETKAGTGMPGSADGTAKTAQFNQPTAIAIDPVRNVTYVIDTGNNTIRRIDAEGNVTTWAGQAGVAGSQDGFRNGATFDFRNNSGVMTIQPDGSLLVRDASGAVRTIDTAGNVTTCTTQPSCRDVGVSGMSVAAGGVRWESNRSTHTIQRVTAVGTTTVAGSAGVAGFQDGIGSQALFRAPGAITVDAEGTVYIIDNGNGAVRKLTPVDGRVTTIAGRKPDGTNPSGASFSFGCCGGGLAVGPDGTLFVTDPGNHSIKKIEPDGRVSTLAGSGSAGSSNGTSGEFKNPNGVGVTPGGGVTVGDTGNHVIRGITTATTPARRRSSQTPPTPPPPSCPVMTNNVFFSYQGAASGCSSFANRPCGTGEAIQFNAEPFGYNFGCASHTFSWNMGDGSVRSGQQITHRYATPGTYSVQLTITNPFQMITIVQQLRVD